MRKLVFKEKEKELAVYAINDTQAFSKLYEKYFPRVYNYVFARVGDSNVADDITSEIFEKVVSKISTYKPEYSKFSTWLFTVSQNTVIDYYRKKKNNIVEFNSQMPSKEQSIDEMIILDEDKQTLLKCMSLLRERERNILSLKFWSELSNREIAEIVDESSNNVAVILYRSIRRLKSLMNDKD